jgi:hypothetical protein
LARVVFERQHASNMSMYFSEFGHDQYIRDPITDFRVVTLLICNDLTPSRCQNEMGNVDDSSENSSKHDGVWTDEDEEPTKTIDSVPIR